MAVVVHRLFSRRSAPYSETDRQPVLVFGPVRGAEDQRPESVEIAVVHQSVPVPQRERQPRVFRSPGKPQSRVRDQVLGQVRRKRSQTQRVHRSDDRSDGTVQGQKVRGSARSVRTQFFGGQETDGRFDDGRNVRERPAGPRVGETASVGVRRAGGRRGGIREPRLRPGVPVVRESVGTRRDFVPERRADPVERRRVGSAIGARRGEKRVQRAGNFEISTPSDRSRSGHVLRSDTQIFDRSKRL